MRKLFFTKWLTTIVLLSLLWQPANGQSVDPPVIGVLDGSLGSIKVDSLVTVQDAKMFNPAYTGLLKTPYRTESIISFEVNEGLPLHFPSGFTATVGLSITYKEANGTLLSPQTTSLTIGYSTNGSYTQKATYVKTGYYGATVKVTSVSVSFPGGTTPWNIWRTLKIVNLLQSYTEYNFSYSGNTISQLSDSAWAEGTDKDELPVWWTPSIGANEYDLEWAYIDSAALAAHRYGNDPNNPNLNLIFAHNATRVSIPATAYRIPIIYDSKGHLFYRVRAVQVQAGGGRYEATWTTLDDVGHGRFNFNGHERTFNWQATTSFAEEGKRKSVVQYYDGSLRGRQTVTKDNSTSRTVVAESFYDYQGRPVIQVLPAPTLNTIIGYTQNFNQGINADEYSKNLFDSIGSPGEYCDVRAAAMDSVSGASQYYSSLSAFKDSGVHKYVPNAGGFPFTEVEYTQDNTGRVNRQGGVGSDFRLGSGHETKYYYSTPDQRELDALFGTEVGDRSHYFKNVVRDANGQYSVSYVDMRGRTIATALAGNPDANLQKLSSNAPATRTEVIADPYSVVIKDLVMEHKKSLTVTTAGNRTFSYQLNPLLLKEAGCNMDSVCYDCLYDLQITITDDCNNQKFAFDTVVRNFSLNAIDTTCDNGTGFSFTFNKWMPEGNYEITKSLSVSRYALDYYRDSIYMAANTCKSLDSFIVEQRALLAQMTTDCKPSCDGCKASLGTWPDFWTKFRQTNGVDNVDTAVYKSMALAAYDEAVQQCAELCDSLSDVLSIRRTMLMDMTPSSGQYANIDNPQDRYSIFFNRIDSADDNQINDTLPKYTLVTNYLDEAGNPDLVFDEGAGKLVPPQNLSPELFALRFKPSWAEALLEKHPEYCKLVRYEQLAASHEWDRKFEAVDSYAAAVAAGYLNPTSQTGSIATYFGRNTSGTDQLWIKDSTFFSSLRDSLNQYRKIDGQNISLWSVATLTVMCPGQTGLAACINNYRTNDKAFNTSLMCEGELDMAWRTFRQLYLDIKRTHVNKWIKTGCGSAMTAGQIVASGHSPHFADANEMKALQSPAEVPSSKAETEAFMQKYYADNCKAYATRWVQDLAPCTLYNIDSLNNVIIPALIAICKEGSDSVHPYGASSVKPSSLNPAQFRSFEAYLKYYNATHSINDSLNCNAYGITAPKPYDQQAMHGNKPLYSKPDTCECTNVTRLYNLYKPKKARYGSFSQYMREVYKTVVEDSVLNTLLSLCGNTDFPAADCDFISRRIFLPPVFQCNTGDVCVDCDKFKQLDTEFRQRFPAVKPVITDTLITDSAQLAWNRVYEQFMNYRLGYVKTAGEYLLFKSQCNGDPYNAVCDSLQTIVSDYKQQRQQQYGVRYQFNSAEGDIYTDLHDLVRNGAIQLPDSIRQRPGGWYNNIQIGGMNSSKYFCGPDGYAIESRWKYLKNTGHENGFYLNVDNKINYLFSRYSAPVTAGGVTYEPGLYISGISDESGNSFGFENGGSGFNFILVDTNENSLFDWCTFKLLVKPGYHELYYNGKLIRRTNCTPALTFGGAVNVVLGIGGRNGCMDWYKTYDANGALKYFEDFLDPDHPAFPDPSIVCPSAPPNCQSSFVTYFNQRTGRSYTASQIDSLYTATCGKLPGACTNTGSLQQIADSFKVSRQQTYGITTRVSSSEEEFFTDFRDIVHNGVIQLPDTIRQRGGPFFNYVGYFVNNSKQFCTSNGGYAYEFRMKFMQDLPSGHAFYAGATHLTGTFTRAGTGLYLSGVAADTSQWGFDFGSNKFSYILASDDPNVIADWFTVKFQVSQTKYYIYFNGALIAAFDRNPLLPLNNTTQMGIGYGGRYGTVDWVKMYDANGKVRYFEDYLDPNKPALPDADYICPSAIPDCQSSFVDYFNQQQGTSYTLQQIEALYAAAGVVLDVCPDADPSCNKLGQLLTQFRNEYHNPANSFVDLDMRTLAGDKTPDEGPKGVFDVNENLIGNTVDGTTVQINTSFAQIWNSSAVNNAVGTLTALPNGRFRLQLNPGQTMPCNGIIGMRYFQFDIPTATLDAVRIGSGSYIDFGDSIRMKVASTQNSHTTINSFISGDGGGDARFINNRQGIRAYKIWHYYSSAMLRTITIYHSDIRTEEFFFDCGSNCVNMTTLKNIRGYIPSHIKVWGFHSTQDSTFNNTANIRNFNQVNTVRLIEFGNGGGYNFRTNKWESFAGNRGMRSLWLDNDVSLPSSQLRPISQYLPNLPQNFPDIAHIRLVPYDSIVGKDMDFRLPKLRALFFQATSALTAAQLDKIIIDLANTTTVDSGALGLWNLPVSRTSASDAAINTLIAKKWWINLNGVQVNTGPLTNFKSALPAPDSIRFANEFSDYINNKLGTNYTLLEILNLYQNKCGAQPDYCAGPEVSLTLCGRQEPVFPPTLLEAIDNCSDSTFFIQSKAQDLYRRYTDSLKGRFDSRYMAKCMQAYKFEKFTVRHTVSEYHYTLYYYDQAGNLVKTISPAGVRPNYDSLWLDSVSAARLAKQVKVPAHLLPTQYRYNTLDLVTAQKSPDGGKTEFWYDRLGRLALSRNARQLGLSSNNNYYYSYARYDVLGRITEVGQVKDTFTHVVNDTFTRNEVTLVNWHDKLLNYREQVTNTVYDIAYDGFTGIDGKMVVAQQNVRNRVSYITYTDTPGLTTSYNHGSFYSYDIHGNVDTLLQDYGRSDIRPNLMNKNGNRWKKFVYEYDLISGKVNKVQYQPGYSDQWAHRYFYDAENRLTEVQTSGDGYVWEKEAKYEYYLQGPLARTILGQQQVQGVDYAYTLQGWLKGVNSTGATATHDIGGDGKTGTLNQYVGRDALGFNLNYFLGDYKPVNPGAVSTFPAYKWSGGGLPDTAYRPLYNGNISSMATHIRMFDAMGHVPILYNFKYDQLNRIVKQDAYFNFNVGTNTYGTNWAWDQTFHEEMAYDANGNFQSAVRHAIGANSRMDELNYHYYAGTNQLRRVTDNIDSTKYGSNAWETIQDLDTQPHDTNYVYDAIGNLVQDKKEGITNIKWNVYGKIMEITRNVTTRNNVVKLVYNYDAQGNRIGKVEYLNAGTRNYTWYVRDAQGKLISTYAAVDNSSVSPNQLDGLQLSRTERQLYGSSRLGAIHYGSSVDGGPGNSQFFSGGAYDRGRRQYELTNHLSNVLTTVSDRKIGVYSNGSLTLPNDSVVAIVDYYEPHMVNATDYYAFGMPSRIASSATGEGYRFGFNGKENDNEVKGFGNQQDYGMRIYDPRVGRFLSVDPLTQEYPWYTPYQFAGNNPIRFIDLDGAEPGDDVSKYWENQPQIDMTKATTVKGTNSAGFPRNGVWAARQQFAQKPEMFSPDNQFKIFKQNIMPEVDEQWVKYNPTHAPYMGNTTLHHHIDGQNKAVIIPKELNREKFSELHAYLKDKVKNVTRGGRIKGISGGLMNFLGFLGTISMFNASNPDALINAFSGGEQPEDYVDKVKKDFQSGVYVEITGVKIERLPIMKNGKPILDKNGNPKLYISKRIVNGTLYSGYIYDEDSKRYRGVDKIGTREETWTYDQNGNRNNVRSIDPDKIL
jgi:RHS repeat-associated protein